VSVFALPAIGGRWRSPVVDAIGKAAAVVGSPYLVAIVGLAEIHGAGSVDITVEVLAERCDHCRHDGCR